MLAFHAERRRDFTSPILWSTCVKLTIFEKYDIQGKTYLTVIRDSAHLVLNPIVQMQRHIFRDQDWFPGLFRDDWLLCLSRVTNFLSIKRYPQCRIPKTMTNKIRSISTMFLGGRTDFLTHHSSLNLVQHLSLVYNEHIACSPLP